MTYEQARETIQKIKDAWKAAVPGASRICSLGNGCSCVLCLADNLHQFLLEHDSEIDVDGRIVDYGDRKIILLGKATRRQNGTWGCLANVGGALCLVEVKIRQPEEVKV